jgi:hypothetical protein
MELQNIEPLLLDYAWGATTPEVSALIEAYQEKDAEARSALEQWREVAQLARRAIPAQESITVPIFPWGRLQGIRRTAQWRRAAVRCAALAACLMLGYLMGSQVRDRAGMTATLNGARPTLATTTDVPVAAVKDFGSPSWWRAMAQQNANRPVRSSPYSFKNLSILFHQSGG